MWQIKSALGRLGGLMWAAVDPESLRNSGLGGIGPNSIYGVAKAAHGVLQLGGADSGGGLSGDSGESTSFLGPVTTLIEAWAPPERPEGAQTSAATVAEAVTGVSRVMGESNLKAMEALGATLGEFLRAEQGSHRKGASEYKKMARTIVDAIDLGLQSTSLRRSVILPVTHVSNFLRELHTQAVR